MASLETTASGNDHVVFWLSSFGFRENDRRSWIAHVLSELLGLAQFGLTPTQTATHDELVGYLCNDVDV